MSEASPYFFTDIINLKSNSLLSFFWDLSFFLCRDERLKLDLTHIQIDNSV